MVRELVYYKFELDLILLYQPWSSGSRVLTHWQLENSLLLFSLQVISDSLWSHVHGVLEPRILEWYDIPSSSGPRVVRILHCDPPILGGPAWLIASLSYINPLGRDKTVILEGAKTLTPSKRSCSFAFFLNFGFWFYVSDQSFSTSTLLTFEVKLKCTRHLWGVVLGIAWCLAASLTSPVKMSAAHCHPLTSSSLPPPRSAPT